MREPLNELWHILGLRPGEDYLPDRNPPILTDAVARKIHEAERNPPTPEVAEWFKIHDERDAPRGVVVAQEVAVFSGPSEDATVQFKIHEGTVVSVRDARNGWVRVDLPGDLSGWVEERTVERI